MPTKKSRLSYLRNEIQTSRISDHREKLESLIGIADLGEGARSEISARAAGLVLSIRKIGAAGLLEEFFKEYGLSTREGIALMHLAEALLRVPDAETRDALIEDKVVRSEWGKHLWQSGSTLVNASTLGLMAAGAVLEESTNSFAGTLHNVVRRVGEPVIRLAIAQAMKFLGERFVLGEDIEEALEKSRSAVKAGYSYSYDMLGEAARTMADAEKYYQAYADAVSSIAYRARSNDIRTNPGISIKLSALHPRYEESQRSRCVSELSESLLKLAQQAGAENLGLNVDAEENDRLDLSLEIIENVLTHSSIRHWNGFGVVVQAYSPCAASVIEWLHELAKTQNCKVMVRLVKGAYWDTEIKRAQTLGLRNYPVFTRKSATDVSYMACVRKLFSMTDRIYPQFATHNAHTVSTILHMAKENGLGSGDYEFQRLHGMGEALHQHVLKTEQTRCRIYAPVGVHQDLLAYLVRRLLENGANSSFINQIVDEGLSPGEVAADPIEALNLEDTGAYNEKICKPSELYGADRKNSKGWDLSSPLDQRKIEQAIKPFLYHRWTAEPVLANRKADSQSVRQIMDPGRGASVGEAVNASEADIEFALDSAVKGFQHWSCAPAERRASILRDTAALYEECFGELYALLMREAGKNWEDCVSELREAVDFLRYYASGAMQIQGGLKPRGVISCISPWNFPLAIFTGQIAGALAAGNSVLAKPAETTPLIAAKAVSLFHKAGVPVEVLQLLLGSGRLVGHQITGDPRIAGVCFTGSLQTAQTINRALASGGNANAMLIAETGGLNAMIVDSTALPEQVTRDIIASAFQSAGQRCSALRMLYVQEDIAEKLLNMLYGAMDELKLGDPSELSTDIGPVINESAKKSICAYLDEFAKTGKILKQLGVPDIGSFVPPTVLQVRGIEDLNEEVFGPVLHIATYEASELPRIIESINKAGYGLTFGVHSRIEARIGRIASSIEAGNIYINRNQIGAIVESQPFGGEGMSGTGPKAGGPLYLKRFLSHEKENEPVHIPGKVVRTEIIQEALNDLYNPEAEPLNWRAMPGSTGESNTLTTFPRGTVLCLGPTEKAMQQQIDEALKKKCRVLALTPEGYLHKDTKVIADRKLIVLEGAVSVADLTDLEKLAGVSYWGNPEYKRMIRNALADRTGPIIPLITEICGDEVYMLERHVCINTAAAGGDTALFDIEGR